MPTTITYRDLLTAAQSADPAQRKDAFETFKRWTKMAPQLKPTQRLTMMERSILLQVFEKKGLKP